MHELRCDNKILFGILEDRDGVRVLEVKCRSRRCGYRPGAVIIHRFSVETGIMQGTLQFRDPNHRKEVGRHAAGNSTAVRPA